MKHSQCCHAIHKEYENIDSKVTEVICTGCHKPCTLEDIPVHTEGLEDRILKIQTWYIENQIILSPERNKRFVNKIVDFIKSERELLVDRIDAKIRHMILNDEQDDVYIGKMNAYMDVIDMIK